MTTIYLVRHSEPFKDHKGIEELCDNLLEENKKTPLSVKGEELAKTISLKDEFKNLDAIWSSDYVRAMSTAKYFAENNNLKVNISYRLGERTHGINSYKELPSDFMENQFNDENYKIGYGESRKDVTERMFKIINELLDYYKNKRILIVSHSTSLAFLLSKWCEISFKGPYKYKNNIILNGKWNYCEAFKLTFDENNELIDIKNINNLTKDKDLELELGFKLDKEYNYYMKLMKEHNGINSYNCETRDLYWTKLKNFENCTENEIKKSCIRIRITRGIGGKDVTLIDKIKYKLGIKSKYVYYIQNTKLYKNDTPNSIKVDKNKLNEFIKEIESKGFYKIFDTFKTDYQYRIGNMKSRLQFQNINDIGLVLYYDNPDLYNLPLEDQRKKLIDEINSYGFNFDYKTMGIDKLRTLYYKENKYSKNQNG